MTDKDQTQPEPPPYRVIQKGRLANLPVSDFDSLVTHHPGDNARAKVVDGIVIDAQRGRRHAVIAGEIDEIAVGTPSRPLGLAPDQILQKKDFILENPNIASGGAGVRDVDVPSPFAGYVGRAGGSFGTVDIYDRQGGTLVARVLHLDPIHVAQGSTIEYGQALGIQNNKGLPTAGKHVHMEVDTAHLQGYEAYVNDLVGGRLSMDASRRTSGITSPAVIDDGVIRIGESSERVRDVQQHLNELGYRDANGRVLEVDGTYHLAMQAAVLRFQTAHGLPASGDIDAATLRAIPSPDRREPDRLDHVGPGQPLGSLRSDRSDHRAEAQITHPLYEQAQSAVRRLDQQMGRAYDVTSERLAASLAGLAQANGLERIDHVVLGDATDKLKMGENVFVVQGGLTEPTNRVAYMKTQDALAAPVEHSLRQLAASTPSQTMEAPQHTHDAATRQPAHRMTV